MFERLGQMTICLKVTETIHYQADFSFDRLGDVSAN